MSFFKKNAKTIILTAVITIASITTSFAASRYIIQAVLDNSLKIKFNGNTQYLSSSPIIYKGTTYLPVKAVSDLAGLSVKFDSESNTLFLSNGKSSSTSTPSSSTTKTPSSSTATKTSNTGTLKDPIKYGTSFSWYDESKSKSYGYKSHITISVTNAKKLSLTDLAAMGLKPSNNDSRLEYLLVSLNLKGENVTPTTIDDSSLFYSLTKPYVWGSATSGGNGVIGSTAYGFDGSVDSNMSKRYPSDGTSNKINKGSSKSIDYSGNIILTVFKDKTNYLVIQRANEDLSYDARKIYFALQ